MVQFKEEMVPLREAENEVKVVTQRLALLHLAYARTLVVLQLFLCEPENLLNLTQRQPPNPIIPPPLLKLICFIRKQKPGPSWKMDLNKKSNMST